MLRNFQKLVKVRLLLCTPKRRNHFNKFIYLPVISRINKNKIIDEKFYIFGNLINLKNINWHLDYVSKFEYPINRFDKIDIAQWYNKGFDVKFSWEISRFNFALSFAQNYIITQNKIYYHKFKKLVIDWIDKNPFIYGVNWNCTMEVAIRAINWIVSINIFRDVYESDIEFSDIMNRSLVQHAEYISFFPELRKGGHSTNHATSNYVGLLFLALTLRDHPKYKKWLNKAIKGLLRCMEYQIYDDGVDFEGSIPYHRLVLEMFAYSAVVCRANNVELPTWYYEKLFKMFEFTAAYMDHNGNAPQVGDNDSGRILIFHESDEHDHSYLLDLGEHIFDYSFKSQCKKNNPTFKKWLPKIDKITINELNIKERPTDGSIAFEKGGIYFLKNNLFSLSVACLNYSNKINNGHHHFDNGSITLSYMGEPMVVDLGTSSYTRNFDERNYFRNYKYHNTIYNNNEIDFRELDVWETKEFYTSNLLLFNSNEIKIEIINQISQERMIRHFIINKNNIVIKNKLKGNFYCRFNINPNCRLRSENRNCIINDKLQIETNGNLKIEKQKYSHSYGINAITNSILISNENSDISVITALK